MDLSAEHLITVGVIAVAVAALVVAARTRPGPWTVPAARALAILIVVCTNMAGSVPDAADLVVSDPVEAGVMAVMLVADTARFSIERVRGRRF